MSVLASAVAGVLGCGGTTYPVHGKVVFKDGTPMTGGMVVFEPLDAPTAPAARAPIQPDGTFRLSTYRNHDGALEGRHRVLVAPPLPSNFKASKAPQAVIHPRFEKFETSKLEFTVGRGDNEFTIEVEKPPRQRGN